jgi:hypothetical protein
VVMVMIWCSPMFLPFRAELPHPLTEDQYRPQMIR